ncbi:MAG: Autotransporter-associated beta strand repeat protein [Planctomycetes bacterium ADurb.Bin126]|nr:MAG: Autotransporter-associated beta strand repeat protein [Planctomycetes bacterium ADurb.Bin126]HOD82687.1 autotransporter-associated beta strand repeat-containing protein [Phycisphaerae bacterium]
MRTWSRTIVSILAVVVSCLYSLPASGDTAIWTGSGGDGLWGNGNNWSTAPSAPAAADVASFTNAGAGAVNLGGGTQTVAGVQFSNDAGSPFTLQSGTLAVGAITQGGTGSNTISALLNATSLAGGVSAGRLDLSNTANSTAGGTWTVSGGTLGAVGVVGGTALGTANVTLSGGTLELQAGPMGMVNGVSEKIFDGVPYNAQDNIEGYRGATLGTADAQGTLTGQIHYNSDGDVSTRAAALGAVGFDNNNFSMLWVGEFTPTESGSWGFRFNHVDDNASIWVDFDRNGVFSQSGTNGIERIYSRGCCAGSGDIYTLTSLTAGTTYKFGVVMSDTGGGGDFRDMEVKAPSGSWVDLTPSALGGLFQTQAIPEWIGSNAVAVTANSAIRIGTDVPTASLGSLTMAADTTLTVDSASKQTLAISGSTTLQGGTATFNLANQSVLVLNNVGESVASNLTASGNGTLRLATANTYTGVTTIAAGATVELGNNAALGDEAGKTVIESGGTLDIKGYRAGANGNELVEVQGAGVGGLGAIKNTGGGQTSAFRQITMTGDATFRADSRWDIRNTGGAATFDMNGHTLTKVGGSELCLVNTTVANPGSVNVNQGIFRIEGSTVFDGSGTIAVAGGATLDFYANTATHSPNVTLQNGANLTTNGSGGPTISGAVTVNGTANVVTNYNLTLSGQVSGGTIQKSGNNTLILTNPANNFSSVVLNGGAVRIANPGALGNTTSLSIDGGQALEFDGTMAASGTALTSIAVNGGSLKAVSGTTTLDVPINVGLQKNITFGGAGNLVVTQGFGNGGTPIWADMLNHYGYRRDTGDAVFNLDSNGGMINAGNPTAHPTFTGQDLLIAGPAGRGLNFDSDQDFMSAVGVPSDNYSNLWIGRLHVTADTLGTWQFRDADRDDWSGIWFDLNNNGTFESTVAGLGSNRGEQLAYNDQGAKSVNITTPGDYLVAFTHLEGGGGSRMEFRFKSPTMASETTIKPGDPAQAGIWQTFLGVIPSNNVVKNDTGVLTLAGENTFDGAVQLSGGTVIAAHDRAFGVAGGHVQMASGTSVGFVGGITVAGENITGADGQAAGQSGTLVNVSGNNTFLGDISASEAPVQQKLTIASQSGTLTVGAAGGGNSLNLNFSQLAMDGPGDIVLNSDISGRSGSSYGDGLRHYGFHINNDGLAMDLNNNAGMYNLGNPPAFTSFYGQAVLTSGPGNRGLDFNDDNDFINTGAIGQVDNYSNLFVGYLHVDAATAGDWNLRINQQDDPTGIWIDLDRDGVFESATAGLGSDRGEQLLWSTVGTRTVSLAAGDYLVAFTHREGGGGSGIEAQFQAPGMSALTTIKPSDPAQAGIWQTLFTPTNDLTKTGTGTATLAGNNSYAGLTKVQAGTLIAAHNNALGSTAAGTVVSDDATLGLRNNVTIAGESLTIGDIGSSGRGGLRNIADTNTWVGDVTVTPKSGGQAGIGSDAGTLTVQGGVNLGYSKLIVNGAGDTVITGAIGGLGTGEHFIAGGLQGNYYDLTSQATTALLDPFSNLTSLTPTVTLLTPRVDFGTDTETVPGDGTVLDRGGTNGNLFGGLGVNVGTEDVAGLWTGWINITTGGAYTFTTRSDDGNVLYVDGSLLVNSNYMQGMTNRSGTVTLTPGLHEITLGYYERGGGAGMQLSYAGPDSPSRQIIGPDVLGERYLADNSLIKQGTGTLSLNGTNTYDGQTVIEQGRLNVNGSIVSPTIVQAGGVLGGTGSVFNTVSGDGLISPGTSAGTLTISTLDPSGGMDFGFEFTEANVGPAGVNDVLAMGAMTNPLGGANTVGIYLNTAVNWGDVFLGGFAMPGLDLTMLAAADWEFFVAGDGNGLITFEGNRYYPLTGFYGLDWHVGVGVSDDMLRLDVQAPEPVTLALLALAAGGLGGYVRRRRVA